MAAHNVGTLDTAANLAPSHARVYLVSGMQDSSVPIISTEVLYAQLRVQGRDVTFRRLPGASHGLMQEGKPPQEAWNDVKTEYDAIMAWFDRH